MVYGLSWIIDRAINEYMTILRLSFYLSSICHGDCNNIIQFNVYTVYIQVMVLSILDVSWRLQHYSANQCIQSCPFFQVIVPIYHRCCHKDCNTTVQTNVYMT